MQAKADGAALAPDAVEQRQGAGGARQIAELLDVETGYRRPQALAEAGRRRVRQRPKRLQPSGRCLPGGLGRPLESGQRQREHGAEPAAAALAEGWIGRIDRL